MIYLDNNATTKIDDRVFNAMLPFFKEEYANPSSMYDFSRKSASAVKESRAVIRDFVNAQTEREIIFTSCGSESANTAIKGVCSYDKTKRHIITTAVEHPCVINTCKMLESQGYRVDYIGVNSCGELDLDELKSKIGKDTALVSVMYANNETGVIYPVKEISQIIKSKNPDTKFFVDAVQAAGKIPIDVQDCGIDLLGISGHKFHAPKGIGALYVNSKTSILPLITGGHQERGLRAGTENVPYIAGLAEAARLAIDYLQYETVEVKRLRDKLETGILSSVYNARLNSSIANRVPNTANIGFEYIEGELILLHLSDLGICASSGSACTSGSLEPSHVLRAMGTPFTSLHGSIRFSLSRFTCESDIDYVLKELPAVVEKLNNISPFQKELAHLKACKKTH